MSSLADQIVAQLLTLMPPIELLRIVEMEEAGRLSSLSVDTLTREHGDKLVKLSSRRNGDARRACADAARSHPRPGPHP